MADNDPSQQSEPPSEENKPSLSWKKAVELVLGVFQLQRSVERLQKDNERLQAEVRRLQRLSDEHSGQLKAIMALIESTVNERAVRNAENAAARVVQQLLTLRDDTTARKD
jgi:uncharacterized protein YlxW (UPF0749 family)